MTNADTPKRAYPGSRRNGSWGGRTTTITLGGEPWHVPRGFGATYLRVAKSWTKGAAKSCEVLSDILSLVGYQATATTIAGWPLRKRIEAEVWACCTHMRASDNPVQVPPRPEWMGEPWKGPQPPEAQACPFWESPNPPTVLT